MNLMYTTRNSGGTNSLISSALRMAPYVPVYDENNWWGYGNNNNVNDNNGADNPMTSVHYSSYHNKDVRIFGNIFGSIDFTSWLRYYVSLGINYSQAYTNNFTQTHVNGNEELPQELDETYSYGLTPLLEQTLTFDKTFGEHAVTVLGGMSISRYGGGRSVSLLVMTSPMRSWIIYC